MPLPHALNRITFAGMRGLELLFGRTVDRRRTAIGLPRLRHRRDHIDARTARPHLCCTRSAGTSFPARRTGRPPQPSPATGSFPALNCGPQRRSNSSRRANHRCSSGSAAWPARTRRPRPRPCRPPCAEPVCGPSSAPAGGGLAAQPADDVVDDVLFDLLFPTGRGGGAPRRRRHVGHRGRRRPTRSCAPLSPRIVLGTAHVRPRRRPGTDRTTATHRGLAGHGHRTGSHEHTTAAAELGTLVRAEHGLRNAVHALETIETNADQHSRRCLKKLALRYTAGSWRFFRSPIG